MSSLFTWDSKRYELKVTEMDNEHKKLIEIMNDLYDKNKKNAPKPDLLTSINELCDFVVLHFQHEETHLEKIRFPGLANHKGIHQRLLSQLRQHKADFESSESNRINEKFFEFLSLWLAAHIQHIDMQYSPSRYGQSA
ncbi:MAG: hypothetical protein RJB66_1622 [Pseudomonadota bacterium]